MVFTPPSNIYKRVSGTGGLGRGVSVVNEWSTRISVETVLCETLED